MLSQMKPKPGEQQLSVNLPKDEHRQFKGQAAFQGFRMGTLVKAFIRAFISGDKRAVAIAHDYAKKDDDEE